MRMAEEELLGNISEEFFTTEEVGELLKVDRRTVQRWIHTGKLKAYRMGRRYRVTRGHLEDFRKETEDSGLGQDRKKESQKGGRT